MKWCSWKVVVFPMAMALAGCREGAPADVSATRISPPLEVEVVPVVKTPIESSIELTGTLFPWKFATIASEVTGVVEQIPDSGEKIDYQINGREFSQALPLDIGDQVKQGDVLVKIGGSEAKLELRLAEARQLAMEKELANLYAWKRPEEIAQLQAQCDECEAVLVDSRADLARAQSLVGRNAISRKEVEDAERSVATATAARARAQAALALAQAGPTAEQIAVAQAQLEVVKQEVALRRDKLDKCTIRCPLKEARIVERYVGAGDHVTANPSTPLMRIVDPRILLAQVSVPERYQGLVQQGDMAEVVAEGRSAAEKNAAAARALVVLVNAQIDPDTRTFRVRVGVDNSRDQFLAGTFVKVSIDIAAVPETIVVPAEAISFAKGEPAVFVVRDGMVEKRSVKLGISNRTHYQIVSGLSENEQIVTGDLSLLADGLRVQAKVTVAPATAAVATRSQG